MGREFSFINNMKSMVAGKRFTGSGYSAGLKTAGVVKIIYY